MRSPLVHRTMNITNTATYLGLSRARVYELIGNGKLAAWMWEGRYRVAVTDADAWKAQPKNKGGRPRTKMRRKRTQQTGP